MPSTYGAGSTGSTASAWSVAWAHKPAHQTPSHQRRRYSPSIISSIPRMALSSMSTTRWSLSERSSSAKPSIFAVFPETPRLSEMKPFWRADEAILRGREAGLKRTKRYQRSRSNNEVRSCGTSSSAFSTTNLARPLCPPFDTLGAKSAGCPHGEGTLRKINAPR